MIKHDYTIENIFQNFLRINRLESWKIKEKEPLNLI